MALGGIAPTMKLNEAANSKTPYLKPRLNLRELHAEEMIDMADLVTEMAAAGHPFREQNVQTRHKVEF